jgi:hypothetical protein
MALAPVPTRFIKGPACGRLSSWLYTIGIAVCLLFNYVLGQPVSLDLGAEAPARVTAVSPSLASPYGRRITEVRYQPATLQAAAVALKPGEILSSENLSAAMNQLASHLSRHSEMIAAASGGSALIFTYVDASFDLNPHGDPAADSVAVTLRPLHLSLPLDEIGGRVLPIPRGLSAKAAAIEARSPFLPNNVNFTNDRVLGTSVGARWQFDLNPNEAAERTGRQVRLRAGGLKSVDSAFYSADADARITRIRETGLLRQLSGGLEGASSLEPRGGARYTSRSWGAAAGLSLALRSNSRLLLDTRFIQADHRYTGADSPTRWTTSNEQSNRLLLETIPRGLLGFFRAALWQENLHPRGDAASHRLVARTGYAKEIPLGPNRSIGVEIIGGAGQTWGNIEAPRRYFAGGGQGEFLYESAQSRTLAVVPDGPILRSLGRTQGGRRVNASSVRGGTHFWHFNLNVALPIPGWSRPLIPDEQTDIPGPDGSPQTLKQILGAQVDRTGPNMLQSTLQAKEGLTPDEARARATEIFAGVQPAAHFVINQANVFALKPLLMFDAAELYFSPGRESWTAAGLGFQLTIVTAKFEAGYMRTLSGPTFGSRGNIFARLGFERLF